MLKGKGRLIYTPDGKVSVYIPTNVHRDSRWPFKRKNQHVEVELAILSAGGPVVNPYCIIINQKKEVK